MKWPGWRYWEHLGVLSLQSVLAALWLERFVGPVPSVAIGLAPAVAALWLLPSCEEIKSHAVNFYLEHAASELAPLLRDLSAAERERDLLRTTVKAAGAEIQRLRAQREST